MIRFELYKHAGQVPLDAWHDRGVRIPVFDVDNTLTSFYGNTILPEVVEGLLAQGLPEIFPRVGFASNAERPGRVANVKTMIEETLGVEVYGVGAKVNPDRYPKKPHPAMGWEIADHFDVDTSRLGVIGDRWTKDVIFGRCIGARAIALCDKIGEGDAPYAPIARVIESGIVFIEQAIGTTADMRNLVIQK